MTREVHAEADLLDIELVVKTALIEILDLRVEAKSIGSDEPLFDSLGLNSLATVELLALVEERMGLEIPDEDISVHILSSVRTLSAYLSASIAGRAAAGDGTP